MPRFEQLTPFTRLTGTLLSLDERTKYAEAIDHIHENQGRNEAAFLMEVSRDAKGNIDTISKWSEYYRIDMHYAQAYLIDDTYIVMESMFRQAPGAKEKAAATWAKNYAGIVGEDKVEPWLDGLSPANFDEDTTIVNIWTHPTEDDARADVRRLALSWALQSSTSLFAYAGWGPDAVLLVHGDEDWYIIRTRRNGEVTITGSEDGLHGSTEYGDKVGQLADEIYARPHEFGVNDLGNPLVGKMVEAWLRREAADVMLDVARQILRHRMEAIDQLGEISQQHGEVDRYALNISELARMLHTDRPNLYRLMPSRDKPRRRRG